MRGSRGREGGRRGGRDSRYEWRSRAGGGGGERCGSSIPGVRSAWRRRHPSQGLKLQRSLCLPSRHLLFFVFFPAAATQTPSNTSDRQSTVSPVLVSLEHFHLINHPFQHHSVSHQLLLSSQSNGKKKRKIATVCVVCVSVLLWVCCITCGGDDGETKEGGRQPLWLAGSLSLLATFQGRLRLRGF